MNGHMNVEFGKSEFAAAHTYQIFDLNKTFLNLNSSYILH